MLDISRILDMYEKFKVAILHMKRPQIDCYKFAQISLQLFARHFENFDQLVQQDYEFYIYLIIIILALFQINQIWVKESFSPICGFRSHHDSLPQILAK